MFAGKHSTKKDNYLQTLISLPAKQKMQIQPVDAKTLHEGFSVSLTGLPSYSKASLEGTDPKEKEAKRLKVGILAVHVLYVSDNLAELRRSEGGQRKRRGYDCSSSSNQSPVRPHPVAHRHHVLWLRPARPGHTSAMFQFRLQPRSSHLLMRDHLRRVQTRPRYLHLSHNSALRQLLLPSTNLQ
jgi:hypothetical protein